MNKKQEIYMPPKGWWNIIEGIENVRTRRSRRRAAKTYLLAPQNTTMLMFSCRRCLGLRGLHKAVPINTRQAWRWGPVNPTPPSWVADTDRFWGKGNHFSCVSTRIYWLIVIISYQWWPWWARLNSVSHKTTVKRGDCRKGTYEKIFWQGWKRNKRVWEWK